MENNLIKKPNRRSIRLKDYDYSKAGLYFITICTQDKKHLFGKIYNKKMFLNDAGKMIKNVYDDIPHFYKNFRNDKICIMPNHIHFIIEILKNHNPSCNLTLIESERVQGPAPTLLSEIIANFKSITTQKYISGIKNNSWINFNKRLWQRNYWEHIIRNSEDLNEIKKYIRENPKNWHSNDFFPYAPKKITSNL